MKNFNCNKIQYRILRAIYTLCPFSIQGDLASTKSKRPAKHISILIVSKKISLLEDLLSDLVLQNLPKQDFEIIIVFDAHSDGLLRVIGKYQTRLDIQIHQTPTKILADLRNISIDLSCGELLLFLDDDTRIFQGDFLKSSLEVFHSSNSDVLIPWAKPLFGIVHLRYDFLDPFSMTTRCCFYRRTMIEKLGGFLKGMPAYEDIELSIRLVLLKPKITQTDNLIYYHPPLYFETMQKPYAIGRSIFYMRSQYTWGAWLLVYINALRFLPFGILPSQRWKQWFKISWGVLTYPWVRQSAWHY